MGGHQGRFIHAAWDLQTLSMRTHRKDVAGNTMLGKLIAFSESCPWGRAAVCGDPIFAPSDWVFR
jgi:hypothetical protein